MKLMSVEYNSTDLEWKTIEYLPSNSRYILVYSPEFGTSIGKYIRYNESGGRFDDYLRLGELINITHWRELPRYVGN